MLNVASAHIKDMFCVTGAPHELQQGFIKATEADGCFLQIGLYI